MAKDRPRPTVLTRKHVARLERERRQMLIIRYTTIAILLATALILGYGYLDINYLQQRQPVAKVNDTVITTAYWQARVRLERRQSIVRYMQYLQYMQYLGIDLSTQLAEIQNDLNNPLQHGQSVLDRLIEETLIQQEAERRGISVREEEIDEAIQASFGFFPNGTPTPIPTPTEVIFPPLSPETLALVTLTPTPSPFPVSTPGPTATATPPATATAAATPGPTATASPTATPYTLEGYLSDYEEVVQSLAEEGISEADYRAIVAAGIYRTKLFEALTADQPHVEEQVWARHILVADEQTAHAARERLLAGEDFAALAAELSQDPGSASQGGDLGWQRRGFFVESFAEAAFALEIGEISEPVQSEFGFHIIQVLGRQTRPLTAEQYEGARQRTFQKWLEGAKEEAVIEIFDYWMERVPLEPTTPPELRLQ